MDNEFRKENLDNGCIVQTVSGDKFIFLKNANNDYTSEDVFIDIETYSWLALREYDDNLIHLNDSSYNIIKICNHDYVGTNLAKHFSNNEDIEYMFFLHEDWTAEREDIEAKSISEYISEHEEYHVVE